MSDNGKPPPTEANDLHFFPGADDAHRTPLFGGERMPLPIAMALRTYFSISEDDKRTAT